MPIQNITFIGGYDVSDDVISINTEHVSSQSEAVEPSTAKVVLSNRDLTYGKAIVNGAFIPGHTRIQSIVVVTRNVVNGSSLTKVTTPYILFTGVVNNASYTNETATIDCICESGFGSGSSLDRSWGADTFFSDKVAEWQGDIEGQTGAGLLIKDRTSSPSVKKSQFVASKLSFNEALRAVSTGSSKDFYFATDEELIPMVVLADDKTYYSEVELDPYVLEPGDATTLIGYANEVTVIPENVTNEYVQANVPDPQKEAIFGFAQDEIGIKKYGRIVAPTVYDPGIYTSEDANLRAQALINWYETFIDRGINVTVCNMVPLVRQIVSFKVPNAKTGNGDIKVKAGVNKKSVEYSENGLITRMECRLMEREIAVEPEEDEGSEFVSIQVDVPLDWKDRIYNAAIYGPLGLMSTTRGVLFLVDKSGTVYFTDVNDTDYSNKQILDSNSPQSIKDMFAITEDDLLGTAHSRWGSEFRKS